MNKKNDNKLATIQMAAALLNIPTFDKLDNPRDILLIIENNLEDQYLDESYVTVKTDDNGKLATGEIDINKKNLIRARKLLHQVVLSRIEQFDAILELINLSSSLDNLSEFGIEGMNSPSLTNIFDMISNTLLIDIASPFHGRSIDIEQASERRKTDAENHGIPREPQTRDKKYRSTCMSLAVSALLHANKSRDVIKGNNNLNVSTYSKKLAKVCEALTGGDAIPTQNHEAIAGRIEEGINDLKSELPLNKSIKDYLS